MDYVILKPLHWNALYIESVPMVNIDPRCTIFKKKITFFFYFSAMLCLKIALACCVTLVSLQHYFTPILTPFGTTLTSVAYNFLL